MTASEFETALTNRLSETYRCVWVHNIAKAKDGSQPFDIIGILTPDGKTFCVDCKVLNSEIPRFPLSRIEDNQRHAFEMVDEYAEFAGLAVWWRGDVYFLRWRDMKRQIENGLKSVNITYEKIRQIPL